MKHVKKTTSVRSSPTHTLTPPQSRVVTALLRSSSSTGQLRDWCLRSSYDFPESPEHCSPIKYARVSRCSRGKVVMLFCSSFTQSERFLPTDQLIIRLQVVVMTNFIRMLMRNVFVNVFKSDAVIWWAATFRTHLIDVRQIAASDKVRELCDELLEEL